MYLLRTVLGVGIGPTSIFRLLRSRMFPRRSFVAKDRRHICTLAKRNNSSNGVVSDSAHLTSANGRMLLEHFMAAMPNSTVRNSLFHAEVPISKTPAGTMSQFVTKRGELSFLQKTLLKVSESFGLQVGSWARWTWTEQCHTY